MESTENLWEKEMKRERERTLVGCIYHFLIFNVNLYLTNESRLKIKIL
jgi:hypothetical protein